MATFTITQATPKREKLYLSPIGDLSSCTAWTAHSSVPNYTCVDDPKNNVDYTDYVYMTTNTYKTDEYACEDFSDLGIIDYLKIVTMVRTTLTPLSDTEYYIAMSPASDCAALYLSPNKNLTDGWAKKDYLWSLNPATSVAWSWDDINDTTIGMKAKTSTGEIRVAQIYAEIAYTPSRCSCYPNKPIQISTDHVRNIKMLNFWNGEREVYDLNRSGKSMVLSGNEYGGNTKSSFTTDTYLGEFDSYDVGGEEWDIDPVNMIDRNTATYAQSTVTNNVELLPSNTFASLVLTCNNITKVEVRYFGRAGVEWSGTGTPPRACYTVAEVTLRPVFTGGDGDNHIESAGTPQPGGMRNDWSAWIDITNDTNAPTSWTLQNVKDLDMDVERGANVACAPTCLGDCNQENPRVAKVQIKITYNNNTPCGTIKCIRDMARNGAAITIDTLSPTYFNGDYHIKQFGWKKISSCPENYRWIISLECVD